MSGGAVAHPWKALLRGAAVHPDRPFLVGERPLSYAQAVTGADFYAAAFAARGPLRAKRVLVATGDRPATVLLALATLRLGGVFVPLHPQVGVRTFRWTLTDCEPTLVILDAATAHLAGEVDPARLLRCEEVEDHGKGLGPGEPIPGEDGELGALLYTSGTSGRPRGVMISRGNLRFTTRAIQQVLGYQEGDVLGVFLPLSFDYGLYQVFLALEVGAALFLGDPGESGPRLLAALAEYRISVLPATPRLVAGLLQLLEHRPRPLAHLRLLTNTGDHLPGRHVERLQKLLPQLGIAMMYGQTECKRISILPTADLAAHPDSVGRALGGTEVWVVGPEGELLAEGELGELRVRGPHVTLGYWRSGAETAAQYIPSPRGFGARELATGDLCRLDADGYLYFVGRREGWLKHQGFRIDPREIEDAALEVPGVGAAALVQTAESDRLHLFVVGAALPAPAPLLAHLRRELEPFKVPDAIHRLPELPATTNGKVDRGRLRALAEEASA